MEASRRQPGMLQGLSRFLVQHERCGAGFDVAHPAGLGSGRVSITCRGCGARHEYATATIDVERELTVEPIEAAEEAEAVETPTASQEPPAIPPRPAPYPDSSRRKPGPPPAAERPPAARRRAAGAEGQSVRGAPRRGPEPATRAPGRGRAAPRRRPDAVARTRRGPLSSPRATLVLAVVIAAALGFGLLRLLNDDGGGPTAVTESSSPPQATTPAPSVPEGGPEPPGAGGVAGGPAPVPARPPTTTLRTDRFNIEVPRGWRTEPAGGGLLLEPQGGGRVNVQIYFEHSPELSGTEMARETARFMTREVPGAGLYPRKVELGGQRVYELTARGPGETAIAVDVLRGPYRYLLVRRIFAGAKPHVSQTAGRVVLSFRPR